MSKRSSSLIIMSSLKKIEQWDFCFLWEVDKGERSSYFGKEMRPADFEENDLEEGELEDDEAQALLLRNKGTFDIDAHLAHIGDKVQHLLGVFQKDFQGAVRMENTVARYGGYGTFLPWCESSPLDFSPVKMQQNIEPDNILTHPYRLPVEDERLRGNCVSTAAMPVLAAPTLNNSFNENGALSSSQDTRASAAKPIELQSFKSLKKPGPGDTLRENYGALNTEVECDVSPFSSEGILAQSRMSSPETGEEQEETTRNILKDTSSFPVPGESLLSPLSCNILCLPEPPASNEHISDNSLRSVPKQDVASCPVAEECLVGCHPEGALCSTETSEENVSKVEKLNSNNGSANEKPGDRNSSPCSGGKSDWIEDRRAEVDKRPEINQCHIGEEDTRNAPDRSNPLPTPAQQKNPDHHSDTPTSGSTWSDEQRFGQMNQDQGLTTLPTAGHEKDCASDDDKQSKLNSKRPAEQDVSRASKRAKSVNTQHGNNSDRTNGLPLEKDAHKSTSSSFAKDPKPLESFDSQSPIKKRSSCESAATEVIKEGNDLIDKADSLKDTGSKLESADLHFQAALKFLQGGFLLEPCSNAIAKHREITDSMVMYREAAIFFKSAADEYERHNKMALATLAYKCMEVAHMRAVYSKAERAKDDRHELQMGLLNISSGGSASSGSDVDNFYHQRLMEQGLDSQMAGYSAVVTKKRTHLDRMLNFVGDVNMAVMATTKCRKAFEAAKESDRESESGSSISLVQRVVEFGFENVERLVGLVGQAVKAISQ